MVNHRSFFAGLDANEMSPLYELSQDAAEVFDGHVDLTLVWLVHLANRCAVRVTLDAERGVRVIDVDLFDHRYLQGCSLAPKVG